MNCPDCGAETTETAESCPECGRSLAVPMGTVLAERYEIQTLLGSGGLGRVYRAHDRMLDEVVAVKVLHPEAARSHELSKRFRSEIKLARKVRHRNVCAIHEYGEHGPYRFVAMELVDGVDLHHLIRERGPLPPKDAFDVAIQVAKGLTAIHDAGVIHRDLKTPNIMQDSRGGVRLLDFGIAKLLTPTGTLAVTAVQRVVGTPEYMSPEQIRGDDLDERSDIYALGVVIFEIFTGGVPFQGKSPLDTLLRQVNEPPPLYGTAAARLPTSLVPVLRKALAKDPKDRHASARDLLEALRVSRRAAYPEVSHTPPDRDPLEAAATTPEPPPVKQTTALPRPPLPRGAVSVPPVSTRPPVVSAPAGAKPAAPPVSAPPRVAAPPVLTPPPVVVPPPVVTPPPVALPRTVSPLPAARDAAMEAALDENRTFIELPKVPPPVAGSPARGTGEGPVSPASHRGWGRPLAFLLAVGSLAFFLTRRSSPPGPGPSSPVATPAAHASPAPAPTAPPVALTTPAPSPAPPLAASPEAPLPSPTASPRVRVRPTPAPTPSPTPTPTPMPTPVPVGALDVEARPGAEVEVGGRAVGSAPLQGLQLDPGVHVVKLEHPDYWPLTRKITIEGGKTGRLDVDLSWEGVPRARSREAPYGVPLDGSPDDPYFQRGLRQIAEGEYQEAILTLEPVVRRLQAQGGKNKEQARAEFYLGVAYLELNRQALAKERFQAALEHDGSLRPPTAAFSPKIASFFGTVREAARKKQ